MSKLELENLKKKIGVCPQLVENGRLLHMREPLGFFNEWTVLTYNLQILGQYIKENAELRKKIIELMDTYIEQIVALGNVRPGDFQLPRAYYCIGPQLLCLRSSVRG